jgi:hypothetical protein
LSVLLFQLVGAATSSVGHQAMTSKSVFQSLAKRSSET